MAAIRSSASTDSRDSLSNFVGAYPWLRGYVLLPWLLPMTVWFVGETGVRWLGWGPWVLFAASLVVAFFGHRAIVRWYDRRFGLVWYKDGADSFSFRSIVLGLVASNVFFLVGVLLLPPLLIRWGVPEVLFGPVYHWPWVLASAVVIVAAIFARPYFSFIVVFGAVLLVLALLPLGEWFEQPGDRHLFRTAAGGQGLRLVLVLGYALASHAALLRGFRRIQQQFGVRGRALHATDEGGGLGEGGDME